MSSSYQQMQSTQAQNEANKAEANAAQFAEAAATPNAGTSPSAAAPLSPAAATALGARDQNQRLQNAFEGDARKIAGAADSFGNDLQGQFKKLDKKIQSYGNMYSDTLKRPAPPRSNPEDANEEETEKKLPNTRQGWMRELNKCYDQFINGAEQFEDYLLAQFSHAEETYPGGKVDYSVVKQAWNDLMSKKNEQKEENADEASLDAVMKGNKSQF